MKKYDPQAVDPTPEQSSGRGRGKVAYNPQAIEHKWQKVWEEKGLYKAQEDSSKEKFYVLDMFPYPSGEGLHVGHVEGYTATDIFSRYKRMQGYNVLHPMGWDAFGLPAENYAIKTGTPPKETTQKATDTFRRQMKRLGFSYDWSREIGTHTPDYYKWTQWLFLLLYKNGLAYKKAAKVNWDPVDQTVLANEQVLPDGTAERSGAKVVQKDLEQWFFKITDFVEDLIQGLDDVDWPDSTKEAQRNWIGRSEGTIITFKIPDSRQELTVFTTRADTLYGATFIVVALEHPIVASVANVKEVREYVEKAKQRTEREGRDEEKEKTGVFSGLYAVNPLNEEKIPVWIADYAVMDYGTGALFGDAHDERDVEFARKYNIPLKATVITGDKEKDKKIVSLEECFTGYGTLVDSGPFTGLTSKEAVVKVTEWLAEKGQGGRQITYRLRDWLISRQRYWGAPIPIVYDPEGKPHPVSEEHLPWLLPTDVEFKPTGTSPLAQSKELQDRVEKIFGKGWRAEVDTMDTFVCSSWYYFRFADTENTKEFASLKQLKNWLPVDLYVGGAEHTVMHLLYARFFTKALHKLGYVDFTEPFLKLRHPGTILGPDNRRMSKRFGNVVNPDDVVEQHGADTLRMYEMFIGPLAGAKPWNTQNIIGIRRFLDRVWCLQTKVGEEKGSVDLERVLHQTIQKVGGDVEALNFNTAISQLMICANEMDSSDQVSREMYNTFLLLLAPFAPHLAEELWERGGNRGSIHEQEWPQYNTKLLKKDQFRLIIQVNGKVRDVVEVAAGISGKEAEELALKSEKIQKWTGGKVKKAIYVPGRLINIVA